MSLLLDLRTRGKFLVHSLDQLPWRDCTLFHVTMKGKTSRSLPKSTFRNQRKFQEPVKVQFGVTENHWVSKDTVQQQVKLIEEYRIKTCRDNGWDSTSKMLILWDVYVCHRDPELMEWMKDKYQSIIVLYIPANLKEIVYSRWMNTSML